MKLKELLETEMVSNGEGDQIVEPIPILHNKGVVILQFFGWSLNLNDDGTWIWEATDGG